MTNAPPHNGFSSNSFPHSDTGRATPFLNAASRPDRGGDTDFPGGSPDEIQPQQEPATNPGHAPDEVSPGQGDFDQPDSTPIETPEPPETPSAPD